MTADRVTIELIHGHERRILPATVHPKVVVVSWPMSAPLEFDRRTGAARSRLARRWRVVASDVARLNQDSAQPLVMSTVSGTADSSKRAAG